MDSKARVWVGTLNGLSVIDGDSVINYTTSEGLSDDVIWGISEYDGDIYVTTRKGINVLGSGGVGLLALPDTLFGNRINAFVRDAHGGYWLGYSGHGILHIDGEKNVRNYGTDEGLSSDLIYSMNFDAQGNLIVGTERGVDVLQLANGQVNHIKSFGQVEGFADLNTTYGATYYDGARMWFGTDAGAYMFNSDMAEHRSVEPLVYISSVKLYHEDVNWAERGEASSPWLNLPDKLDLSFSDNDVVFQYYATSLRNPEAVRYKYRLLGLDDVWSPVTKSGQAVFTNLSPGTYTFEVLAANSDGQWTSQPASYSFSVIPPFYMRWWFFVCSFVAVLLVIKAVNDYRIKARLDKILTRERIRAEELQKVRKKMARDFHDNLGNQLASISVYANLMQLRLQGQSKEVDDLIGQIQKHAGSLFSGTKDFIWSMDPDSDELNEIYTYIRDFGEDLFNKTTINFYAEAEGLNSSHPMPSGWSRQLVLIFKEAMTNALKHSQASRVDLKLHVNNASFVFELSDDGVGIDAEDKQGHQGLRNMVLGWIFIELLKVRTYRLMQSCQNNILQTLIYGHELL